MGPFADRQVKFGRRGAPAATDTVEAEDVRCGVAALHTLSRDHRHDPGARASCLYYALRSRAVGVTIKVLQRRVDDRIAAFEWMLANPAHRFARGSPSAAFEAAVYEAIATEPLISVAGRPRFDAAGFAARLERALARPGAAASRAAADVPEIEIIAPN